MFKNEEKKEEEGMSLEVARDFARENAMSYSRIVHPSTLIHYSNLRCVDDRIEGGERIAGPGGGLGIVAASLAAVEQLGVKEYNQVCEAVEKLLGGMSYHSDDHDHGEGALPSAGCGHVAGILSRSKEYGLNTSRKVLEQYIERLPERGYQPEILKGDHKASAVIVIDPGITNDLRESITLPGKKAERQAFICNKGEYLSILSLVADALQKSIPELGNIPGEQLKQTLRDAWTSQLSATLGALAKGLPMYKVNSTDLYVESL